MTNGTHTAKITGHTQETGFWFDCCWHAGTKEEFLLSLTPKIELSCE